MIKGNYKLVFQHLSADEFITADALAKKTKLSNKTVRNCISSMRATLESCGVFIISKPRFGYRLNIIDHDKFEAALAKDTHSITALPTSSKERVRFILELLVSEDGAEDIDDLAELLYVTRSTILKDIKIVKQIIGKYNLILQKEDPKGLFIIGSERDIRNFIEEELACFDASTVSKYIRTYADIKIILKIINEAIRNNDIYMPEVSYLRLLASIMIQINRIELGKYIDFNKEQITSFSEMSWEVALNASRNLSSAFHIEFNENELSYLYLNFISKGIFDTKNHNFTIKNDIEELVTSMLEDIKKEFNEDFSKDFELRMQLTQHLFPMSIRIRYDFFFDNPLIDEIKKKYPYAFNVASQSIVILVKHFNKYIPQDEVGYLALIFQLAIERRHKEIHKVNVLIVCASGKGSSQLLKYKYKKEFDAYLDNVFVCDLYGLSHFDYKQVDYVFTTVPIDFKIPLPIHEVSLFLDNTDVLKVKGVLQNDQNYDIQKYYKPEHFIASLDAQNKFEAIRNIIYQIIEPKYDAEALYDSIIKRENLATTEFGNYIAMPHSMESFTQSTIVYIAILKQPIIWAHQEVQMVILTLIGKEKNEDIQVFYESTTNLFYNESGVRELINTRSYEQLIKLLK